MEENEATLVICQNAVGNPNFLDRSFVGRLHEDQHWDAPQFELLSQAISVLALNRPQNQPVREMSFDIFNYIMGTALIAHVNPEDLYRIENIRGDQFFDVREKLEAIFAELLGSRRLGEVLSGDQSADLPLVGLAISC